MPASDSRPSPPDGQAQAEGGAQLGEAQAATPPPMGLRPCVSSCACSAISSDSSLALALGPSCSQPRHGRDGTRVQVGNRSHAPRVRWEPRTCAHTQLWRGDTDRVCAATSGRDCTKPATVEFPERTRSGTAPFLSPLPVDVGRAPWERRGPRPPSPEEPGSACLRSCTCRL